LINAREVDEFNSVSAALQNGLKISFRLSAIVI
jgi:hypothetical protein